MVWYYRADITSSLVTDCHSLSIVPAHSLTKLLHFREMTLVDGKKCCVDNKVQLTFRLKHGSVFILDPRDELTDEETETWLEHAAELACPSGFAYTMMFRVASTKKLVHSETGFLVNPQYRGQAKARQYPIARQQSVLDVVNREKVASDLASIRLNMLCRKKFNQWSTYEPVYWNENEQTNFHTYTRTHQLT